MIRLSLLALGAAFAAGPALSQAADPHAGHGHHHHHHHDHGRHAETPAASDPHAAHRSPAGEAPDPDPHAGHDVAAPDPHAGHGAPTGAGPTGADLPVGGAPPPPTIRDNAADRVFGGAAMARARGVLAQEHGGGRASKLMLNLAEYDSAPEGGGYRWDVEGWWGGDINRLVVKSEGEGARRGGLEHAEAQALWSRAVARYTDVRLGVRRDFEPAGVTYAVLGVETLLPYWFEVEASLFLSERGRLQARLEGAYDLRLTQRLVLEPRAELELAAQDAPETGVGRGLSGAELGLRLRYEVRRELAPYIGVSYSRAFGRTADFVRAHGDKVEDAGLVVGVRAWF